MKDKIKGFTIVELIFTIVIIGILAIVAVPVYRGYVKRSMSTEAKNLLSDINIGERSYFYRTGKMYATVGKETTSSKIGVDSRRNKYFTSYTITTNENVGTFIAVTSYNNKALTLRSSITGKPEIIDSFSNQAD